MAVSSTTCYARVFPSFECRPDPEFSSTTKTNIPSSKTSFFPINGVSSLILRFPPNFVRQLSTKARRNCGNIGVAQVVAASWSNNNSRADSYASCGAVPAATAVDAAAAALSAVDQIIQADDHRPLDDVVDGDDCKTVNSSPYNFLSSDGSLAIHAGERLGRGIVTDAITTPVVNTSAYFFKKTADLIDFKEGRQNSFEYGRYGNPTSQVLEEKISALEGAESTMILASGMCASIIMMLALVPAGGHIVTTNDCYRRTRMFIENFLPKMGISATIIDPADVEGLKSALDENNVSLFFTESPNNLFLRCVDIKLVSEICHKKGALVCIDGTFASPLNQKALALGADLVLHSMTKFIGGHNYVLGGCISGSQKLVSVVRDMHHIFGGTLNLNASYTMIRGMKTLHLRMAEVLDSQQIRSLIHNIFGWHNSQQNTTALRMAEVLEPHPKIIDAATREGHFTVQEISEVRDKCASFLTENCL